MDEPWNVVLQPPLACQTKSEWHRQREVQRELRRAQLNEISDMATHDKEVTPGDFPFLLQGSRPFLGRPFFLSFLLRVASAALSFCLLRVAPRATPACKQNHAR